jgi:uncharacterized protein YecE (DUF72 family)
LPRTGTRKDHGPCCHRVSVVAEIRTGTSSWTSDSWWGRVYPEDTLPGDRLRLYALLFDCVEVDATYYSSPARRMVEGWYDRTPDGFLFALKLPRDLLDPKKAIDTEGLHRFVEVASTLREKLGPVLLQFPPWVKPARNAAYLAELLRNLPSGPSYAVELRDEGWFSGETRTTLLRELRDREAALAWSSLHYVEVPPEVTSPELYLRFIGDHTSIPAEIHGEVRADRTADTKRWAERLRARSAEVRRALVFFNNHYAGFAPASLNLFREIWGQPRIQYGRFVEENRSEGGRSSREPRKPSHRRLEDFE